MNKELEEAIKRLKILECDCIYFENGKCTYNKNKCQREQDIETVLNYIDNSISKEVIENKLEKLDKEEKEAQDSISDEEREEYSDSSIGYLLANIETRRQVLQELLEGK